MCLCVRPSLSLSLSLFPMPALYQNEWTYRHISGHSGRASFYFLLAPTLLQNSTGNPSTGALNVQGGGEILQIIAIYLENGKDRATLI